MKRNNLHRIFEPSDCLYNPQDYIEGKLSADEQYYFEKHILSCSICRDEYEGLLAMHDTKELPSIVKELNKQVDNYLRPTVKPVFIKKHKIWSIAAFILVLIGSGFFINYYTQYSAKEFAAEEMVSQSVESNDNTPSMAFDSTAKPVTISSSNNSELKNKLNDQAINRKISKTSSEKKIEPKDDKFDAIESTNIVDDKFGIEEDEVYEEAEVSESIISSESKNKLAVNESKETISLNSKKQQKDEAPLTNYEPTSDFNRAKSSGINRKTVKGYTVENYLENGIIAYKNGEYKKQ